MPGVDTWTAISTRRNVRRFSERSIPPEALDRVVDAARRAPSSKNEQRWAFVVCTERDRLRQLARVGDYAGHLAAAAAAVALVTPEAGESWERESIAFDAGQAAENAMLAAWELGIGSCHASVYEEALASELLGYPKGMRCDVLISLGYPADPRVFERPPRDRRPLAEVRHDERYHA
jgi:nitroreductase